jgi:hypothetical protein
MDYSSLTDLEILTAAEHHNIELLTPTQRFNCIRKIKKKRERLAIAEETHFSLKEWLENLISIKFLIKFLKKLKRNKKKGKFSRSFKH